MSENKENFRKNDNDPPTILFIFSIIEIDAIFTLKKLVPKLRAQKILYEINLIYDEVDFKKFFKEDRIFSNLSSVLFINFRKNFLIKKFGVNPAILKSLSQDEKKWVEEVLHIFHPASKRYRGIRNDQKATISDKQYDLDKINQPTLILHALDDHLVNIDFATHAHAHIRNSELITFSSGGHFVVGIHQQCRSTIAGFLKKHF